MSRSAYAASLAEAFEDWAIARKKAAEERDRRARDAVQQARKGD